MDQSVDNTENVDFFYNLFGLLGRANQKYLKKQGVYLLEIELL